MYSWTKLNFLAQRIKSRHSRLTMGCLSTSQRREASGVFFGFSLQGPDLDGDLMEAGISSELAAASQVEVRSNGIYQGLEAVRGGIGQSLGIPSSRRVSSSMPGASVERSSSHPVSPKAISSCCMTLEDCFLMTWWLTVSAASFHPA